VKKSNGLNHWYVLFNISLKYNILRFCVDGPRTSFALTEGNQCPIRNNDIFYNERPHTLWNFMIFSSPCIVRCRPNSLMLTWVQHAAHVDETNVYILGCRMEDLDLVIV
jgi:hypothetical protein